MRTLLAVASLMIASLSHAQVSTINLGDQLTRTFTLPAGRLTTDFFVDVPAGVTRLRIDLVGNASAGDIDLFVRKDQPFITTNSFNQPVSDEDLLEYAHYYAIGGSAEESILITPSSGLPISVGRYYIVVKNFQISSTANIKATFNPPVAPTNFQVRFDLTCGEREDPEDCKCEPAAWNDPTSIGFNAPGNTGVSLGEKRRNAMLAATQLLASQISTEQPVIIRACFGDLGTGITTPSGSTRVTLAQASPRTFTINDPSLVVRDIETRVLFTLRHPKGLRERNSWTAIAPSSRNAGSSGCRLLGGDCSNHFDLSINFNSSVDTPQALGARGFYYGTTPRAVVQNSDDPDFISVALHEMLHGLGYAAQFGPADGKKLLGRNDMFSNQLVAAALGAKPLMLMTDAERLESTISGNLQWVGRETLAQSPRLAVLGDLGPRMHAPNPLEQGSSVSHLDRTFYQSELMAPEISSTRNLGIAAFQLRDIGWSNVPASQAPSSKIYAGNWFDPTRSGHGFDIQPAGKNAGFDRALVTTYTYDESGLPEYFLSVGQMVDGVFLADASNAEQFSSLGRYTYRVGAGASIDQTFQGRLRIDFNEAEKGAACTENGRTVAAGAGSVSVVARDQFINWCIQPLIPRSQRPAQDFTGHWYSPSDSGWGIGIASAQSGSNVVVLAVLYYPDALGNPRWAYAQSNNFVSGQEIEIFHRNAFCRTCPVVAPTDISAGRMTLTLGNVDGLANQPNSVSFSVNFKGPVGGTFARTNAPIIRLVERPREIQ